MGQQLVFVPECHSTNDELHLLIDQNRASEGTLVITDYQTKGRGQHNATWESERGLNLTFSIVVRPVFLLLKDHFFLSMVCSLGLLEYLQALCPEEEVKIKWPNDILINGKKVAGILIENQVSVNKFTHCIIGIGLNVNQRKFTKAPLATSIANLLKQSLDLNTVLEKVLVCLEKWYLQLRAGNTEVLRRSYLAEMYWRGEKHVFKTNHEQFEGVINGIDGTGRLAIQIDNKLRYFDRKEVQYIV